MSNWYAIFTHARAEQKAQFNLERQGFQSFFPKYRKRRRHARRVETVSAPLFPRYVFVWLDIDRQPWRSINSTLGVHGIVCQGEKPAPLPEGIVEELISRQDESGCVGLSGNTSIARGRPVEITDGPFADCVAIVDRLLDADRLVVLLDLLGRRVKVQVQARAVIAAV